MPRAPSPWPLRRRLGMRLAAGMPAAQAARAEGVAEAEVEALLGEPAFAEVVAAFREVEALPHEERLRLLGRCAWIVLENALTEGDVRVAIFVATELHRGRDPVRTLAQGVIRVCERAGRAPPPLPPVRPGADAPLATSVRNRDPAARIRERGAAHARGLLLAEQQARHRAAAAEPTAAAEDTAVVVRPPARGVLPRPSAVPAIARAATARAARLAGCATAVSLCPGSVGPDTSGRTRWPGGPPFSRHGPA